MYNFKQEILEQTNIESILRTEFPNVRFNMNTKKDSLELLILVVQFKERKQGIATKFMKRLIELAKKNHKKIYLTPDDSYSTEGDMNLEQIKNFYEKLGFKKDLKSNFTHSI